jgi:hypothetical protein
MAATAFDPLRPVPSEEQDGGMSLTLPSGDWRAPFRLSPFRLRFELGGGTFGIEAPVPRFLQAFSRARQIAFEAFDGSATVLGIVAIWRTEQDQFVRS